MLADLDQSTGLMDAALLSFEYISENLTEANLAWDAIRTDLAAVALDSQWIESHNLAPSMRSPTDAMKHIYILEAYHVLHCVVSQ